MYEYSSDVTNRYPSFNPIKYDLMKCELKFVAEIKEKMQKSHVAFTIPQKRVVISPL